MPYFHMFLCFDLLLFNITIRFLINELKKLLVSAIVYPVEVFSSKYWYFFMHFVLLAAFPSAMYSRFCAMEFLYIQISGFIHKKMVNKCVKRISMECHWLACVFSCSTMV